MRTLRQTLEGMTLAFDPDAARDLRAVLQFDVGDPEPGSYFLQIEDRRCTFHTGRFPSPTLTITTPADVWMRISTGEMSGRDALYDGLYQASGDFDLLTRMNELFRPRQTVSLYAEGARPAGPIPLKGVQWLVIGFLPWLFLWLGLDPLTSLAAAGGIGTYRVAVREATWFETGTLAYMLVVALVAKQIPTVQGPWGSVVGSLALAVIWLAPTALRRAPLSAAYSKWRYIETLWTNSTFLHTNTIISLAWGLTFLGQGMLGVAAARGLLDSTASAVASLLLLIPAIAITWRLPKGAAERRVSDIERASVRSQMIAVYGIAVAVGGMAVAAIGS